MRRWTLAQVWFRVASRAVFAVALMLLSAAAFATQWAPRKDVGVAAVERTTGRVLWEAWQVEQVPATAPPAVKEAVAALLDKPEQYDPGIGVGKVGFPSSLGNHHVVQYAYRDQQYHFTLHEGTPDKIGQPLCALDIPVQARQYRCARGGTTLYLDVDNRLLAMTPPVKLPPGDFGWKPDWTFDLLPTFGLKEADRMHAPIFELLADADSAWVIHERGLLQITAVGKKKAVFEIKNPWRTIKEFGLGTHATFGKRLIYHRHGMGIVAFDRETGGEVWRLPTTRSPYPSRVVEMGDDLTLVQIGSDVPRYIRSARQ